MKRFLGFGLGLVVVLGVLSSTAYALGLPLVLNTSVNSSSGTLTINGQNFGSSPAVTLNASSFPIAQSGSSQIVVAFPNDKPLSTFTPGTYLLTLTFKNQLPVIFTVMVGAIGPVGSAGAPGAPGPAGPIGPQGVAGVAGAIGPTGPIGAPGRDGSPGAPGAQGPQGTKGDVGPVGPSGNATLASFNDLAGIPCTFGSTTGALSLHFDNNGVATSTCVDPNATPPPPLDGINNTFWTPRGASVGCGNFTRFQGTTSPAGTEDWFVVNFIGACVSHILLTPSVGIQMDVISGNLDGNFQAGVTSANMAVPGKWYIRVYGATPDVVGTYTLTLSEE